MFFTSNLDDILSVTFCIGNTKVVPIDFVRIARTINVKCNQMKIFDEDSSLLQVPLSANIRDLLKEVKKQNKKFRFNHYIEGNSHVIEIINIIGEQMYRYASL